MPQQPEKPRSPEQQPPYYLASRFPSKQAAEKPYFSIQETLHTMPCDLSAYRFKRQWQEPSPNTWYVLVIGEKPKPAVEERITKALSQGEQASVPQEALEYFLSRRLEQSQYGSWVEGHYTEQGLGIRYTEIKFSRRRPGKGRRRRK
jgi:hypothetical protein